MKSTKKIVPVLAMAVVAMLATDCVYAQFGGNRGGNRGEERMLQGRGNPLRGMRGGIMGLLFDESVHSELELVEDQIQEIQTIQDESRQVMREMFSEMQDVPREERMQIWGELQERLQERTKQFEERAQEILLPHQVQRLKQLTYQSAGRGRGAGGALSNQALLDELGVSEVQSKELETAAARAREELAKKYQKLVEEAEDDILKVLTSEQRQKYRELVGKPFQFDTGRNRGFGIRRGGFERGGRDRGEGDSSDGSRRDF